MSCCNIGVVVIENPSQSLVKTRKPIHSWQFVIVFSEMFGLAAWFSQVLKFEEKRSSLETYSYTHWQISCCTFGNTAVVSFFLFQIAADARWHMRDYRFLRLAYEHIAVDLVEINDLLSLRAKWALLWNLKFERNIKMYFRVCRIRILLAHCFFKSV